MVACSTRGVKVVLYRDAVGKSTGETQVSYSEGVVCEIGLYRSQTNMPFPVTEESTGLYRAYNAHPQTDQCTPCYLWHAIVRCAA